MTHDPHLRSVHTATYEYEIAERRRRLTVLAARLAGVPVKAIAKAAGITRQTVYTWASLAGLPVQRPRTPWKAPVLLLHRLDGNGRMVWEGREGVVDSNWAGGRVKVALPGNPIAVVADSWARIGDHTSGGKLRPSTGDIVICDNTLGIVVEHTGLGGCIRVTTAGKTRLCTRWALVEFKGEGSVIEEPQVRIRRASLGVTR